MSNNVYPKFKEALIQALADADLDGSGNTGVFAALVDTAVYTYNAGDQFYAVASSSSDVESATIGTPQEITSKTYVNGLLDGADVTFPAVTGASAEALVLFRKNTGANTTWRLIAYFDTGVTGLPVTPTGGDITAAWNASGIVQF